jgi:hypothetical protein
MGWTGGVAAVLPANAIMYLLFLGIALLAAALFLYNLRLYVSVRRTMQIDQRAAAILQVCGGHHEGEKKERAAVLTPLSFFFPSVERNPVARAETAAGTAKAAGQSCAAVAAPHPDGPGNRGAPAWLGNGLDTRRRGLLYRVRFFFGWQVCGVPVG